MRKYENLPKISPEQLNTYTGIDGLLARNSVTNEFIVFDGITAGGRSFMDVEALDRYLKDGTTQDPNWQGYVEEEETSVSTEEEVTLENDEDHLSS